jgi:hypothetical protein
MSMFSPFVWGKQASWRQGQRSRYVDIGKKNPPSGYRLVTWGHLTQLRSCRVGVSHHAREPPDTSDDTWARGEGQQKSSDGHSCLLIPKPRRGGLAIDVPPSTPCRSLRHRHPLRRVRCLFALTQISLRARSLPAWAGVLSGLRVEILASTQTSPAAVASLDPEALDGWKAKDRIPQCFPSVPSRRPRRGV